MLFHILELQEVVNIRKDYMKKTFNCEISDKNVGENVEVIGWVSKIRNLGGLIFIDLRDRTSIIQLVVNPESEYYNEALNLKNEYVIKASGKVSKRLTPNEKIITGNIEIIVNNLELLTLFYYN